MIAGIFLVIVIACATVSWAVNRGRKRQLRVDVSNDVVLDDSSYEADLARRIEDLNRRWKEKELDRRVEEARVATRK